jgi:hypothetical protein
MARFFLNVSTIVTVDVDDSFVAEHSGNIDAIAEEARDCYFAGDCEVLDESIVSLSSHEDFENSYLVEP